MTLISISIQSKGGPGSGNWGHRGIPGKVGGSSPRGAGMSPAYGDTLTRRSGTPGTRKTANDEKVDAMLTDVSENGNWKYASKDVRKSVKSNIVFSLAEASGLRLSTVNDIIGNWADTSNDNSSQALSMQEAVSEEFGVPLSDWQGEKVSELAPGHASGDMPRSDERTLLRAMYNNTQAELKKAGLKPGDTINLYRGYRAEGKHISYSKDAMDYEGNAVESWSINSKVAAGFARRRGSFGTQPSQGIVVSMSVPVENIIGGATTGFGCLNEGEFVILGSLPDSQVRLVFVM